MAEQKYTTPIVSIPDINFNGGLNSTGGPLSLQDNESSDLQNIDFNKFGSILTRNGYTALNTSAIANTPEGDGLHWYEYDSSGTLTRKLVAVADGKLFKMDSLDGTWDNITGALTITATNHCDFENFLNEVYITNNVDVPFKWTGTGNGAAMTVPTGLTDAKFVKQFNNYLFLANVAVSGTRHNSRIYWSNLKDTGTWSATAFIDIAKDDGQEITGFRVLGDRLVVYKSRSIYNVFFTGDADIPFILPGGGKSNSAVGCAGGFTIQDVNNGHIFLSQDGFYFYDGNNSYKISDKINTTLLSFVDTRFDKAVSLNQKSKNRYWCALTSSGQTTNDRVLVFDYFNNAWSLYTGLAPAAMTTIYVSGTEERPYFIDYAGYTYRADTGSDDYPLNVQTAISSYYYTNWRPYGDLIHQKGIASVYLYYQSANTTLSLAYSYNFESGDTYTQTLDLSTSSDVYGTGLYNTATYAGSGGATARVDLTGRGRVVRLKFENNRQAETFQIDGLGTAAYLETRV